MSEELIRIEDLSIGYNGRAVLSGISLAIAQGSFTGLLGANGSGKSTLIKTLLGIIPPLAGRLEYSQSNDQPHVLGYTPQRDSLDPIYLLSSYEVVLMGTCGRVSPGLRPSHSEREW